jgi:hypothetical protein
MPNMLPFAKHRAFSPSHADACLAVDLVWFQFMSPLAVLLCHQSAELCMGSLSWMIQLRIIHDVQTN